jgi:hypothetical protein
MRTLCVLSFALLAMTSCGSGSQEEYFDPESAATTRGSSYTDTFPDAPVSGDTTRCPDAFPTGGAIESDHAGVGPFFCAH